MLSESWMVPVHYSSLFAFSLIYREEASLGQSTPFHPISTYLELELVSLILNSSLPDFSLAQSIFPKHTKSPYETKILNNFPLFPPHQMSISHDTLSNPFLIVQSVCWSHYATVFYQCTFKSPMKFLSPSGSEGKESACNAVDVGMIPGSGRSPGERNGNLLQYSCLVNPMDKGAWWVHWGLRVRHDRVIKQQ